ncbi:hypothetical protein D3C87_1419240 [compost metagenome]
MITFVPAISIFITYLALVPVGFPVIVAVGATLSKVTALDVLIALTFPARSRTHAYNVFELFVVVTT